MKKKPHLSRPATSAIAAFLAISTPAALAQTAPTQQDAAPTIEMSPPVMVPPVAPTAPTTVPSPTTAIPAPEAAQPATPVIRVPLDIEPQPAVAPEPAQEAAPKAARAEARAPAPRVSARDADAAPSAARTAGEPAQPTPADAAMVETAAPPAVVATLPDTEVTPAPRTEAATETVDDSFAWELAGGTAALLIAGGAAFAFVRRRRATAEAEPAALHEALPAPGPAAPFARPETSVARPPLRSAPAFAAAPHGSMGRHEAMAMAGPTEDNPFLTLKKRLKRARFYDRRERMEYEALLANQKDMARKPASAWDIAQRPAPAPAEQEVVRPQPAGGRGGLRPGLARG